MVLVALFCLLGTAVEALAEKERGSRARSGIGPDQAAGIVRQSTGGRVLGVRPSGGGGYDVKVLTPQGRVSTRRVDGRTGAVDR